jgi:hypothetical protein
MAALVTGCLAGLGGCMAESANRPGARAARLAGPEVTCKNERPTGSNIARRVCQPERTPAEDVEAADWRNRDPFRPIDLASEASYSTDTPGLRIYKFR